MRTRDVAGELVIPEELSTWERFKRHPDAMAQVFEAFGRGASVAQLAAQLEVPSSTLYLWLNHPSRAADYARAREIRAEFYAEEVLRVSQGLPRRNHKGDVDTGDVALRRLQADSLRWLASKMNPRRYGERVEVDATVKHDVVGELKEHLSRRSRLPVQPVERVK